MTAFLILAALSAGFMVFALIRFARESRGRRRANNRSESHHRMGGFAQMWDIIFLAATTLFFLLAILYVGGCEHLR